MVVTKKRTCVPFMNIVKNISHMLQLHTLFRMGLTFTEGGHIIFFFTNLSNITVIDL